MLNTKITEKDDAIPVALIFLLIVLPVAGGIFLAKNWSSSKSEECDGKPNSPRIFEISGELSYAHGRFFIPGENRNWIVFTCGRRCSGDNYEQFKNNLGKPFKAAFCNNQLLWAAKQ